MPNWCENTLLIKGTNPVIAKLIEDNPQLEIECEYFEPGMWFAGTITKEGLKELSDEEMDKMYPDWCEPVEE